MTGIGLPTIDVIFKGLSNSAVTRSGRGIACIIFKDNTGIKKYNNTSIDDNIVQENTTLDENDVLKKYSGFSEVLASDYTDENYKIIEDVFLTNITKLFVIKIPENKTFNDIKTFINREINWICFIAETHDEQKQLSDFVKFENKSRSKRLKAICYNLQTTSADDMHIVNLTNTYVTKSNGEVLEGYKYLGRLLGVLAGCSMDTSVTYTILSDLKNVVDVGDSTEDINDCINKGQFVLINDDEGVRIARGINSLQKNDSENTEDMKYITIVEGMDLMYEDISNTFKNTYVGRFKNSYDNQILLISAINSYFRELTREEILDPNFNNEATVDIERQREAWINYGKSDAQNWSDTQVKNNTFRTNVYLKANVKFSNAIEDLSFEISM